MKIFLVALSKKIVHTERGYTLHPMIKPISEKNNGMLSRDGQLKAIRRRLLYPNIFLGLLHYPGQLIQFCPMMHEKSITAIHNQHGLL